VEPTLDVVDASALELFTVDEVAKKLRLSTATIWRLVHAGTIESVMIGRSRRIPPPAVRDYIASLRGQDAEPAQVPA